MLDPRYRLIDLFCGLGGWSIGFHREGFDCVGVDIIDVGYPYNLVTMDIHQLKFEAGKHLRPDVIVASPPCKEFSRMSKLSAWKGQRDPPDPEGPNGMGLVREAMRVIEESKPKYWALENVMSSRPYISKLLGKPRVTANPFVLWGNFPEILWPDSPKYKYQNRIFSKESLQIAEKNKRTLPQDFAFDPLRSWKRARMPVWVGQTVARACKEKLLLGASGVGILSV